MAMSDRSKKSNLCYLLLYGGTKVCRALFEKRVNDLKPNNEDPKTWTVDKFLQLNRTNLESKLRREHKSKLTIVYPLAPRTTDINLWDVSLLCLILRESCGLSPTLRMYLEQLRKQRNKIAHLNDKEIDDIEYEYRFEKLKECIRKVLSETEDEALKITIQDMTTQLEAGLIPNDELLKVEQTICMSSEDIKQEVRNEHKETRKVIEKGDEKLTSTLEMMYSCQQEILRNQQELLRRFESKEEVETPPQEIMMELRTSHCSPQVERSASEEIVDMFNKEIGGISKQLTCTSIDNDSELSASTKNTIELNHAVNDVCREFQERESAITKAEVGCIVLHIQCSSILSLLNLLQDYINGNLDKSMKKLEEAARSLKGCENLRLETIIYEDEFNRVLSVLNFNQFLHFPAVMEQSSPDQKNNSKEKIDHSRSEIRRQFQLKYQDDMASLAKTPEDLQEIHRRREEDDMASLAKTPEDLQEIQRRSEEAIQRLREEVLRRRLKARSEVDPQILERSKEMDIKGELIKEMQRKDEEMQRKDEEMRRKRYEEMQRKPYKEMQRKPYKEMQGKPYKELKLKGKFYKGMRIKGETKIPHCEMPASTEKAIVEHHELTTYKKTEQDK